MSVVDEVAFLEAFADVSRGNTRVPLSAVSDHGRLPVIDQGQSEIAGYVDDTSLAVSTAGPIIVFGDHTRAVKYVDYPFAMGADGTKLLQARQGFDPRYLYHALRSIDLSSAGYSRHFKFLKEARVSRFKFEEQRRIASILDEADAIRAKRRAQLAHLDDLPQAIFHEMFGDATESRRASELMPSMRNGVSPSATGTVESRVLTLSAITQGKFDPTAAKVASFATEPGRDKRVCKSDFLMCRGNGNKSLVGTGCAPRESNSHLTFPDTMIAGKTDARIVALSYLEAAWKTRHVRQQIERVARTTNGTYKVNQTALGSIEVPVPPLDSQHAFEEKVDAIGTESARVARALEADDELFAALQHRAFRGEL